MLIGGLLFLQAGSPICFVRFLCFCLKKGSHVANMRNADPAIIIAELMMWAKKNKKTVHYYWAQGRNPKELFLLKRDLRPFAAEYSTHSFEPNNSKTAIIFRFFFSVFLCSTVLSFLIRLPVIGRDHKSQFISICDFKLCIK